LRFIGGAAGVGAAWGILFGMMIDQTAWGVILGAVAGIVVGTFLDRRQGPSR